MKPSTGTGRPSARKQKRLPGTTRRLKSSLICLCILLCVAAAGCSAGKRDRQPGLPLALMESTPDPEWDGETVGDLVEYAQDLERALGLANVDKAALRGITEGMNMGKND